MSNGMFILCSSHVKGKTMYAHMHPRMKDELPTSLVVATLWKVLLEKRKRSKAGMLTEHTARVHVSF